MANSDLHRWLCKVDVEIKRVAGIGVFDLADQPYADWFDDGLTPQEAAREALELEGFFLDLEASS
ncbi:MAG: hypothetical protein R3E46_04305 [Sedimenticolaceae bacterium]